MEQKHTVSRSSGGPSCGLGYSVRTRYRVSLGYL